MPFSLETIAKTGTYAELADFLRVNSANTAGELANALSAFVFREDVASTRLLLEHGALPNCQPSEHMPALHCAVEQKNCELVRLLCRHGADVNYPDDSGFTPLHLAVDIEADSAWQCGHTPATEMVELLLTLGANPTARDAAGRTPLSIAESYEFSPAIELLRAK